MFSMASIVAIHMSAWRSNLERLLILQQDAELSSVQLFALSSLMMIHSASFVCVACNSWEINPYPTHNCSICGIKYNLQECGECSIQQGWDHDCDGSLPRGRSASHFHYHAYVCMHWCVHVGDLFVQNQVHTPIFPMYPCEHVQLSNLVKDITSIAKNCQSISRHMHACLPKLWRHVCLS